MGDLEDVEELIKKMLKSRGCSDRAIKEVLKWYSTSRLRKGTVKPDEKGDEECYIPSSHSRLK